MTIKSSYNKSILCALPKSRRLLFLPIIIRISDMEFSFQKQYWIGRLGAVKNQNNFLSNIGLNLGHALASFATYRILSEKLRFSCFSQVPTGSDYPAFRPILQRIPILFWFLQPLFFIFCKNDTDITLYRFLHEKNADWNKKII